MAFNTDFYKEIVLADDLLSELLKVQSDNDVFSNISNMNSINQPTVNT